MCVIKERVKLTGEIGIKQIGDYYNFTHLRQVWFISLNFSEALDLVQRPS